MANDEQVEKKKNEFIEAISLSTCKYFTLMVVDASRNLRENVKA